MIEWLSFDVIAHLWQSTLVIGVVWLMTLALRGNRAQVRHRLWLAASVKFLVPFSWLVSLGAQLEWRTAAPIAQPAATFIMEEILAPSAIATAAATPTAPVTSAWPLMLASIWIVGVAVVLFWWWRQWRLVRTALRQAEPITLGSEYDVAGLTVMSSSWTFEPGVVGIWRPVLLLPEGLADRLTPAQLKALIAHERCHIDRRDNLAAAVHMVVEAMFWFHPLVWWIERRMVDERERACDEAVLESGSTPHDYAEGILEVCRSAVVAPLMCVAGVSGSDLRRRIESIILGAPGRPLTLGKRLVLGGMATLVFTLPLVAGALQVQGQVQFEVASVKPCDVSGRGDVPLVTLTSHGRLATGCRTVAALIREAYVNFAGDPFVEAPGPSVRISGGPDWIKSTGYEITATADGNPGSAALRGPMLRKLLEDRFNLRIREVQASTQGYALSVAPGGPKLSTSPVTFEPDRGAIERFQEGSCIESAPVATPLSPGQDLTPEYLEARRLELLKRRAEIQARGEPTSIRGVLCGTNRMSRRGSNLTLVVTKLPIGSLAELLTKIMDRPVIDRTGFADLINAYLEFAPDGTRRELVATSQFAEPSSALSIFIALQQHLGLKLEGVQVPVSSYVIEHIDKPSPN